MALYLFAWRVTAREIRFRPIRVLLTLTGVVLGVAAVTAVSLGTRATRAGYPGMFDTIAGRAQLELRSADGQAPFVAQLDQVASIEGVADVAPLIQLPIGLSFGEGPEPVLLLGIDPDRDPVVRDYRLRSGGFIGERPGVWLESGFAERHGLKAESSVRLLTVRGPKTVPVAGILEAHGPARFNGGAIAVVTLDEARTLLDLRGQVNSVNVVIKPGASVSDVRRRLESAFPRLTVGSPADRGELAGEFLGNVEQMLAAMGAVAVIAGGLVILNTFLMHLGERQRQLALLRALGATRTQVKILLWRQALLVGSVGALLGVPLGILLAWLLLRLYESFMAVPLPRLSLSWGGLMAAAVLGPAMTLAATFYPARRAAQREPLADLRRTSQAGKSDLRWPPLAGVMLLALVLLFEVAIIAGWLPGTVAGRMLPLAVGCGLIGCACLVPVVQAPLLRLVGALVGPTMGVEGRLAVRGLLRHRARTGLTVGVLFAAVAASIAFGVSLSNNIADIRHWYHRSIDADYFVRAVRPDPAVVLTPASLPLATVDQVRDQPGAGPVWRVRFVSLRVGDRSLLVIARDFDESIPLLVHDGDPDSMPGRLRQGEIALGTAFARRLGLKPGDSLTVPTIHGPRSLRICGLVKEYSVAGMAAYMDYESARGLFGFDGPHAVSVSAGPGESEKLAESLAALADRDQLWVQPNEGFESMIERSVVGVRWLMAGMLVLIGVTTAAGVVNTLTTNVLDQTRELGVLRALGMKRGGVVKLVLAQALTLAGVACLSGGPAGVLLAWLMNRATPGIQGHYVPFHFQPLIVVSCLVGLLLLAMLAALLPARRAARLAIIDAVRYE